MNDVLTQTLAKNHKT